MEREQLLNCILVAEDNEDDRFRLIRAFTDANIHSKVVHVYSWRELEEYLEKAESEKFPDQFPIPDVLFLDPQLTDGNHLRRLLELKSKLKHKMVTAVVSGVSNVKQIREAYEAGADTFLEKPVRAAELMNFFTFHGFTHLWR